MEYITINGTNLNSSRIGLGTWAMGGWMWGGTDETESIRTIHAAFEKGINLIDTAPVYGFGRSEEIVGRAIEQWGHRDQIIIATKVGLDWQDGAPTRNATRERLTQEIEDSLRRLRTTYIDIYQVHWPVRAVYVQQTETALVRGLCRSDSDPRLVVVDKEWLEATRKRVIGGIPPRPPSSVGVAHQASYRCKALRAKPTGLIR